MNKLGFAIKLANGGAGDAIVFNKEQWTRKVVDIREYLKLFNGLRDTNNIVTFMSFDEGGCFLTQLRAISGRPNDFLSGWIYIPNTIEVSGEDIINAYNYARNILSMSNITDKKEEIEKFFSKEYPTKEVVAQYAPSSGNSFGYRHLVQWTLKEIVEDCYQSYYSDYKAIFLLEKDSDVTIAKEAMGSFKDLNKQSIVKTAILVPPTVGALQRLGQGTGISTDDGSDFNKPLMVNIGSKATLYLSRKGFEKIKLDVPVTSERQEVDFSTVKITWERRILASMFRIKNDRLESITDGVRISLNGKDISSKEVLLTEEECRQVRIKISAPDYEDSEQIRSLLYDDFDFTLIRKNKSVKTSVELSNNSLGEMTIESKQLPSEEVSPLKGYYYGKFNKKSILKLSPLFLWKQRLWGFIGGLVVVLLFLWIDAWKDNSSHSSSKDNKVQATENLISVEENNPESQEVENNNSENSAGVYTLENAIKYLDDNQVWTKSEMEKYSDLRGLFNDMDNFNLPALLKTWSAKLDNSKRFMKMLESANKTVKNHWEPKQGQHYPTFNKPGDEQINLTNYINWLDQDQTPKTSTAVGNTTNNSRVEKTVSTNNNTNNNPVKSGNKGKKDLFDN